MPIYPSDLDIPPIQFRRALESTVSNYVPAEGEPVWSLDGKKLYIGDGTTQGGILINDPATPANVSTITNQKLFTTSSVSFNTLQVTASTSSTNTSTGALQVTGGAGIAGSVWAGEFRTASVNLRLGQGSGQSGQGVAAVSLGSTAGNVGQGDFAVAVGLQSAQTNQGAGSVAVGVNAAANTQGASAVAVGDSAGRLSQGNYSVALGRNAGWNSLGSESVVIGNEAGYYNLASKSIAIGSRAAYNTTTNAVIVLKAGSDTTLETVANSGFYVDPVRSTSTTQVLFYNTATKEISYSDLLTANPFNQELNTSSNVTFLTVTATNRLTQTSDKIAIGPDSGLTNQGALAIAIGRSAGGSDQGIGGIAIGNNSGLVTQGIGATAIGGGSGYSNQGGGATAIGDQAGAQSQGIFTVAIGSQAGYISQGMYSVAIGQGAGFYNLSNYGVAIGRRAAYNTTTNDVVVLKGTNAATLETVSTAGFFVDPVRSTSTNQILHYNTLTCEISYATMNPANPFDQSLNTTNTATFAAVVTDQVRFDNTEQSEISLTGSTGTFVIDTWPVNTYRAARYTITINDGTDIHLSEIFAGIRNTNSYHNEFGVVLSDAELVTFSTSNSGGFFSLNATGTGTYRVVASKTIFKL